VYYLRNGGALAVLNRFRARQARKRAAAD
jgi:hypothetical protein